MKGCLGQTLLFAAGAVVGIIIVVAVLAVLALGPGGTAKVTAPPPIEGQPDITLTISENYLNRQLQFKMSDVSVPLLSPGQIALSIQPEGVIKVTVGIEAPIAGEQQLTIDTKVTREADKVKVTITGVSSGIIPVPRQILGALEDQLNNEIQGRINQQTSAKVSVMDVETTDHAITVKAMVEG